MNCKEIQTLLSAHIDRELDSETDSALSTHLESCSECRQERASLDETRRMVQKLPDPEFPKTLSQDIQETLRKERSARPVAQPTIARYLPRIQALAAACLLFALFLASPLSTWNSDQRPSDFDPGALQSKNTPKNSSRWNNRKSENSPKRESESELQAPSSQSAPGLALSKSRSKQQNSMGRRTGDSSADAQNTPVYKVAELKPDGADRIESNSGLLSRVSLDNKESWKTKFFQNPQSSIHSGHSRLASRGQKIHSGSSESKPALIWTQHTADVVTLYEALYPLIPNDLSFRSRAHLPDQLILTFQEDSLVSARQRILFLAKTLRLSAPEDLPDLSTASQSTPCDLVIILRKQADQKR